MPLQDSRRTAQGPLCNRRVNRADAELERLYRRRRMIAGLIESLELYQRLVRGRRAGAREGIR